MEKILNELKQLSEGQREYIVYKLMLDNDLSFVNISKLYVYSLEDKLKENRKYEVMGAVALEAFRPNGMFKGKFKIKEKNFVGGLDGFKAKALLFLKHAGYFKKEYIEEELSKIDKKIIDKEEELNLIK